MKQKYEKQKYENVKLKKNHFSYSPGYGSIRYQGKSRRNLVWSNRREAEAAWRQNGRRTGRHNMDSSTFKNTNWKSISSRFGEQKRVERHVVYSNGQNVNGLSDTGLKWKNHGDLRINLTMARQRKSVQDQGTQGYRSNSTMERALQVSKTVSENFDLSWNKKAVTGSNGVSLYYSDEENEEQELRTISKVNSKKDSESSWLARCYRKRKSLDATLDTESELDTETSKLGKNWCPNTNHIDKVPRVDSLMKGLEQSRQSIAESFMLEEGEVLDTNETVDAGKQTTDRLAEYNTKNKANITNRLEKDPTFKYRSRFDQSADLLMHSILQQKFRSNPAEIGVECSRKRDLGSNDSLSKSGSHLSRDKKSSSVRSLTDTLSESTARSRWGSESTSSSSSSSSTDSENETCRKRPRHKSSSHSNKSDYSNKRFRRRSGSGRSASRSHSHSKNLDRHSKEDKKSQHISGGSTNFHQSKRSARSRHYSSGDTSSSSSSSDRSSSTTSYCSSSSSDRSSSTASSSSDVSEERYRSRHRSASSSVSHSSRSSTGSKDKISSKKKTNHNEESELNELLAKIRNYEKDYNTVVHGQQEGSRQFVTNSATSSRSVSPHRKKMTRLQHQRNNRIRKNVDNWKKSLQRNVIENKSSNLCWSDNTGSSTLKSDDRQRYPSNMHNSSVNSDDRQRYPSNMHNSTVNSDDRQRYPSNMHYSAVNSDERQRYPSNMHNSSVNGDDRQRYPSNMHNSTVNGDERQRYPSNMHNSSVNGDDRQRYPINMHNSTVNSDERQRYPSNMHNSSVNSDDRQRYPSNMHNSTVNGDERQRYPSNMHNSSVNNDDRQRYPISMHNSTVNGDERQRYPSNMHNSSVNSDDRQRYPINMHSSTVNSDDRQRYPSSIHNSTVSGDDRQRYPSGMHNSTANIGVGQRYHNRSDSTVHGQHDSNLGNKGTTVKYTVLHENRHPASYWLSYSVSQSSASSDSLSSRSSSGSSKSSEDSSSDSSQESSSRSSSVGASTYTTKTEPIKQETCSSSFKESETCSNKSTCLQPVKKEQEVEVKQEIKDDGIEADKDHAKDIQSEKLKNEPVESCRLQKVCGFSYLAADEVDSLDATLADPAADIDPYRLQRSPTPMGFSMLQDSTETDNVQNSDCTEEQPCKDLEGCFDSGVRSDETVTNVQDHFQTDVAEACPSRNIAEENLDKEQLSDSLDVYERYSRALDASLDYDTESLERNGAVDDVPDETADHELDDGQTAAAAVVSICPYSSSDEDLDSSVKSTEDVTTPEKVGLDSEHSHKNYLPVQASEKKKMAKDTENVAIEINDDKRLGKIDADTQLATVDLNEFCDRGDKGVVKDLCVVEYVNIKTGVAEEQENKSEEILIGPVHCDTYPVSLLSSASSDIPNGLGRHEMNAENSDGCRHANRKSDLNVDDTQKMSAEREINKNLDHNDNDSGEIIHNLTSDGPEKTETETEGTFCGHYGGPIIDILMIEAAPIENTLTCVEGNSAVNSCETQESLITKSSENKMEDASSFLEDGHRALRKASEEIMPSGVVDTDSKISMHTDVTDEVAQLQTPSSNSAATIDNKVDCFLRQIRFNTSTKVSDETLNSTAVELSELTSCSKSIMHHSCEPLTDGDCSEQSLNVNVDAFAKIGCMDSNSKEWKRGRHLFTGAFVPEEQHPDVVGLETICRKESGDARENIHPMSIQSEETCHSGRRETVSPVSEVDTRFSTSVGTLRGTETTHALSDHDYILPHRRVSQSVGYQVQASPTSSDDGRSLEDHISAPILKSIKEKQAGLEKDFQKDCEVMVSVTKFLLSKDPGLQARLESCLHECLTELSDRFVESFQEYMTKVKQGRISAGNNRISPSNDRISPSNNGISPGNNRISQAITEKSHITTEYR